ncbi:hypothetical protein COOONC_10851 [Cooperia oncophora]
MAEKTDFQKRLMVSAAISLGHELHLFEALAKVGSEEHPAGAEQVAVECGCRPRYVKEWLSVMATGNIIEVNEDEKFWIRKENVTDLTSGLALQFNLFLPVLLKCYDKVCEVFKIDGPYGLNYSEFSGFYKVMTSFSEALHRKHLSRLENGEMMCLDVGCGSGFHAALLAETYPKSNFTGIDVTLEAVHQANQRR